jgi:hypothetical protein
LISWSRAVAKIDNLPETRREWFHETYLSAARERFHPSVRHDIATVVVKNPETRTNITLLAVVVSGPTRMRFCRHGIRDFSGFPAQERRLIQLRTMRVDTAKMRSRQRKTLPPPREKSTGPKHLLERPALLRPNGLALGGCARPNAKYSG